MSNLFADDSSNINEQINKLKELLDKTIDVERKEKITTYIENLEKIKNDREVRLAMNKFINTYIEMDNSLDLSSYESIEKTSDINSFLEFEEEKKVISIIGDTMSIDLNSSIKELDNMQQVLLNGQLNKHIYK